MTCTVLWMLWQLFEQGGGQRLVQDCAHSNCLGLLLPVVHRRLEAAEKELRLGALLAFCHQLGKRGGNTRTIKLYTFIMGNREGGLTVEEEQSSLKAGSCWRTGIFKAVCTECGISPAQTPQNIMVCWIGYARQTLGGGLRETRAYISELACRNFKFPLILPQSSTSQ